MIKTFLNLGTWARGWGGVVEIDYCTVYLCILVSCILYVVWWAPLRPASTAGGAAPASVVRRMHAQIQATEPSPDILAGLLNPDGASDKRELYGPTAARFYILFAFCLLSFNQCLFWITFSPIASNAKLYYGINDATIALLMNWGPIIYIPVCFATSWLTAQKNGLRRVCVGSAVVTAAFMVIRCIPSCKFTRILSVTISSRLIIHLIMHMWNQLWLGRSTASDL